MKPKNEVKIIDIIRKGEYEKYLYKCLAPMPFRKYRKRDGYLSRAIPQGFRKKLLVFNGDIVGTIEYAPAKVPCFSIRGDNIVVMNCIWVLRRAKGHNLGKQLMKDMIENEKNAAGFTTIGLEHHWSPWMRKDQMETLGFKAIDSVRVRHRTKNIDRCFTMHLMWLPATKNAKPPTWNKTKLLEGVDFCMGHPLYHPESLKMEEIYEKCQP